jgi:hypothetical protein
VPVIRHVAVGGSTSVVLMKHRVENRMVPVLRYRGISGVELSREDTVALMRSLVTYFSGTPEDISEWWRQLTKG